MSHNEHDNNEDRRFPEDAIVAESFSPLFYPSLIRVTCGIRKLLPLEPYGAFPPVTLKPKRSKIQVQPQDGEH